MTDEKQQLIAYLDSIVGKRLYKMEQLELSKAMNIRFGGELMKSRHALYHCFEELGLNYYIRDELKDTRKLIDGEPNPHRNRWYWIVSRLECTPAPAFEQKAYAWGVERTVKFIEDYS